MTERNTSSKESLDHCLVTVHNFKSTNQATKEFFKRNNLKFGNKSFRLVDELWRKSKPITYVKFKSLYDLYEYIPYELCYNRSDHSTWEEIRKEKYLYCEEKVLSVITKNKSVLH